MYRLEVEREGLAPFSDSIEIRPAIPAAGKAQQAAAHYGEAIVQPSLSVDVSAGGDLWKKDKRSIRWQADIENLNNRLNVIDFAGLFSGNAIAPPAPLQSPIHLPLLT